jgi:hypothetical protein
MTITSTEERLAPSDELEPIATEPGAAQPVEPGRLVIHPPQIGVDVEEAEEPGARTDWTTRFAWAKTLGGW